MPESLSAKSAEQAGFCGPVVHSSELASRVDKIISDARTNPDYLVVVVGGGRSAQE